MLNYSLAMLMSRYRPLEHHESFHNEVKTASEYTQQSVRMGSMLCLAGANAQNFTLGSHPYLSQNNEEDILTSAELSHQPMETEKCVVIEFETGTCWDLCIYLFVGRTLL